jgi:predicted ATPase
MADEDVGDAYLSWLKELTPVEIDTVIILQGAIQDSLFAIKRRGLTFPAPVLSDGTLRFSAIAAAFFQADMPETLLIEEIENGIHPTRLRLLVELLKSESENGRPQVMATSHSPLVLAWLDENDYKTVFLCQTDEKTGASTITPFASIPGLIELAREQSVADLFAEGWMETAL